MNKYPDIAIDVVLFSYFKESLNVLLVNRKIEPFATRFAFPGVFIKENETADEAALRALSDETRTLLDVDYLEQLYTFTEVNRDPRQRIISISYFGLINQGKYNLPLANNDASFVTWVNCRDINVMRNEFAFDHIKIYDMALTRLKTKIQYEPIGLELLHEYFTLKEFQKIYETILEKKIDTRNFRRKVMSYGLIKETQFKTSGHVGPKSRLFEFDTAKYNELKKQGIYFEI